MKRSKNRFKNALLIGLFASAFTSVLSVTGALRPFEFHLFDRFLVLREGTNTRAVDSSIRLVLITENTHRAISEPQVLWVPYYTKVTAGLLEAGAKVVAWDFIPTFATPKACQDFNKLASKYRGKIVLGYYLRPRTSQAANELWPPEGVLPLLREKGLGSLNLPHDPDGVARRIPIFPFPSPGRNDSGMFFAPRIAEAASGNDLDPVKLSFGKHPIPLAEPNEPMLINYRGRPSQTFPAQPFDEVLDSLTRLGPTGLQTSYSGKVVLIGSAADADQDLIESPLREMRHQNEPGTRGVEVQAQILNTLLSHDFLQQAPQWQVAVLLVAAGVVVSWLALSSPIWLTLVEGVGFVVASLAFSFLLVSHYSLVLPAFQIATSLAVTWLCTLGYRLWSESLERRRLESIFGRYVAPQVMAAILQQQVTPSEEPQRRVTVLYSDINDFSKTCRTLPAHQVAEMLNVHFQELSNVIFQHEGTILRFIGDQFMVVFGAPTEMIDHEARAISTALAIVNRLAELRETAGQQQGFYHVKIGIHVGDLILTSIGNEKRSDYIAVGESANVAVRIQEQAKSLTKSGILVSKDIQLAVAKAQPGFALRPAGTIEIKGQSTPIEVYEVEASPSPR